VPPTSLDTHSAVELMIVKLSSTEYEKSSGLNVTVYKLLALEVFIAYLHFSSPSHGQECPGAPFILRVIIPTSRFDCNLNLVILNFTYIQNYKLKGYIRIRRKSQ